MNLKKINKFFYNVEASMKDGRVMEVPPVVTTFDFCLKNHKR